MYKTSYMQVQSTAVIDDGTQGVSMRWVISEKEGAENFALRIFTVEPGGHTPLHTHPWEHEVFVLKGKGAVVNEGKDVPLNAGDVVFVPADEEHQFKNVGDSEMEFICLIPISNKCTI